MGHYFLDTRYIAVNQIKINLEWTGGVGANCNTIHKCVHCTVIIEGLHVNLSTYGSDPGSGLKIFFNQKELGSRICVH